MIWYLLVCFDVYSGSQCLDLQKMPSETACRFAARHYEEVSEAATSRASTRCIRF